MTATITARPPGFLLKMRLLTPRGAPLARKRFRVQWGDKMYPARLNEKWETDDHGALSVLLDEPRRLSPQGRLHVMDGDGVVWSIALHLCEDPPPVALPELGIGAAPAPPPAGASPEEQVTNLEARVKHEARRLARIKEIVREFRRAWEEVHKVVTALPGDVWKQAEEERKDGDLLETWDELAYVFALVIRGYEAAWRLWNLAALPLDEPPTIQLLASDTNALLRALDRFSYRHGLLAPIPAPIEPEVIEHVVARIREVHDARGRIDPKPSPLM